MADVVTGALQVDLKRRTTLPSDILAAAGIPPGSPLVARVEEPGRIVLESPQLLLSLLQDDIAAAVHTAVEHDPDAGKISLIEQLLADRAADASLDGPDEATLESADNEHAGVSPDVGTDLGEATGQTPGGVA